MSKSVSLPVPGEGATRWRHSAVLLVPSVVAIAAMTVAMAEGVLAARIGVTGQAFQVSAESVNGTGMTAYPASVRSTDGKSVQGMQLGFRNAELRGMCLTAKVKLPALGDMALVLKSDRRSPVQVRDFSTNSNDIQSTRGQLENADVGIDASTLTRGGPDAHGPLGRFGMQSSGLKATGFKASSQSLTTGSLALSGLGISLHRGAAPCS